PIRTSSDHSSVVNSPTLNADSHVLRRLLLPRHPPCALQNLRQHKDTLRYKNCLQDARVHYAVLKKQPHTPTTNTTVSHGGEDQPHTPKKRGSRAATQPNSEPQPRTHDSTSVPSRVRPSQPIAVRADHSPMFRPCTTAHTTLSENDGHPDRGS